MNRSGRFPPSSGDPLEDARRELRWAMGGAGLTVDKLELMRAVLALPGVVTARSAAAPGRELVDAHRAVADAVRSLGDGPHARILRTALGIDYAGSAKDLTARRTEFIRTHNDAVRAEGRQDYIGETTRAMYDVENAMLHTLLTVLGAPVAAPDLPPVPPAAANTLGAWAVESLEATMRLTGRAARQAEIVRVLYALDDGLETCELKFYCSSEGGRPAELVLHEGGEIVSVRELGRPNFRVATVRMPRLRRGERHRLRYDICYPGRGQSESWFSTHVTRATRRVVVRVSFDREQRPERLWAMDAVPPDARGGNVQDSAPLALDEFGSVEVAFAEPTISMTYGVAWDWPA